MERVTIRNIGQWKDKRVTIKGWLYNRRSSGKIQFLILRDGTGFIQGVMVKSETDPRQYELAASIPQESSLEVTGLVKEDLALLWAMKLIEEVSVISEAEEYPISLKEHGVDFLLTTAISGCAPSPSGHHADPQHRSQGHPRLVGFPGLHPGGCAYLDPGCLRRDHTTPFETDYFGDKAYLSQSGQLYMEAAAMALGRAYCFGPTFRAENPRPGATS